MSAPESMPVEAPNDADDVKGDQSSQPTDHSKLASQSNPVLDRAPPKDSLSLLAEMAIELSNVIRRIKAAAPIEAQGKAIASAAHAQVVRVDETQAVIESVRAGRGEAQAHLVPELVRPSTIRRCAPPSTRTPLASIPRLTPVSLAIPLLPPPLAPRSCGRRAIWSQYTPDWIAFKPISMLSRRRCPQSRTAQTRSAVPSHLRDPWASSLRSSAGGYRRPQTVAHPSEAHQQAAPGRWGAPASFLRGAPIASSPRRLTFLSRARPPRVSLLPQLLRQ